MRRYVGVVTALALVITVGLPPDALPDEGGFPLRGLFSWLQQSPAWAEVLGIPVQQAPDGAAEDHDVPAEETRADGGAGQPAGKGIGAVAASLPEPPNPKPWTAPPAVAGAESFDERTSKRRPERSREQFTEYENTDGSVTRKVYGNRVNYRDAKGRYQAIDTDLTPQDGRLTVTASPLEVSVAATAADPALASVVTPSGDSVAFGVEGAAMVPAASDGARATYQEILPLTDLETEVLADGLRTSIVLRGPPAENDVVLPLELDGLTARSEADGEIVLADSAGKPALRISPEGSAATFELTTVDDGPALKVTADPAQEYPVRIASTIRAADASPPQDLDGFDDFGDKRVKAATLNVYRDGKWVSTPLDPEAVELEQLPAGDGEFQPFLAVTAADNVGPQVNEQYPGYGQAVQTLYPQLLADASDPDLGPRSLTYTFIVYRSDAKTEIGRSSAIRSKSWTVPGDISSGTRPTTGACRSATAKTPTPGIW